MFDRSKLDETTKKQMRLADKLFAEHEMLGDFLRTVGDEVRQWADIDPEDDNEQWWLDVADVLYELAWATHSQTGRSPKDLLVEALTTGGRP